jgi:hypothetical protein
MKIEKFNEMASDDNTEDIILEYLINNCELVIGHPNKDGKGSSDFIYHDIKLKERGIEYKDLMDYIFEQLNIDFSSQSIFHFGNARRKFMDNLLK